MRLPVRLMVGTCVGGFLSVAACGGQTGDEGGDAAILYLHHSTGGVVWNDDYWNIWVAHEGTQPFRARLGRSERSGAPVRR